MKAYVAIHTYMPGLCVVIVYMHSEVNKLFYKLMNVCHYRATYQNV